MVFGHLLGLWNIQILVQSDIDPLVSCLDFLSWLNPDRILTVTERIGALDEFVGINTVLAAHFSLTRLVVACVAALELA